MITREDCVFKQGNECRCLTVIWCPEGCKFHADKAGQEAARAKANARLSSLPETVQQEIARTYYNGRRPWESADGSLHIPE